MKYIKPKSLTWWAGFVPLMAGVLIAAADTVAPPLQPYAAFVTAMAGNTSAAELIGWGLALIGLRGAVQ